MVDGRAALGRRAEEQVAEHLRARGCEILARNARVGRLELDIVARCGRVVVFCEVRARRSDTVMYPSQSIHAGKQGRIRRAALRWLRENRVSAGEMRFDAASVVYDTPEGRLTYLEGAF